MTTLRIIQKKMKKLERAYSITPEACRLKREKIEKKMQKLMDKADWIRREVTKHPVEKAFS